MRKGPAKRKTSLFVRANLHWIGAFAVISQAGFSWLLPGWHL